MQTILKFPLGYEVLWLEIPTSVSEGVQKFLFRRGVTGKPSIGGGYGWKTECSFVRIDVVTVNLQLLYGNNSNILFVLHYTR